MKKTAEEKTEPASSRKSSRGQFIGWCNICGGDCFNFVRHRCPERIPEKTRRVIHAASALQKARTAVRTATLGTWNHEQKMKAESEAFDQLDAALAALNAGNTNGEEG